MFPGAITFLSTSLHVSFLSVKEPGFRCELNSMSATTSILFLVFTWTTLPGRQYMIGEYKLCKTNTLMAMMYRYLHVDVNWNQGYRPCTSADNHWVCFRALWAQPDSDLTPLCCHIIQTVKCMNSLSWSKSYLQFRGELFVNFFHLQQRPQPLSFRLYPPAVVTVCRTVLDTTAAFMDYYSQNLVIILNFHI